MFNIESKVDRFLDIFERYAECAMKKPEVQEHRDPSNYCQECGIKLMPKPKGFTSNKGGVEK